MEKLPDVIQIDVIKEKIDKKEPPPPPPETKAPPPPFVPPPDIVIQVDAPPPQNTITTQSKQPTPPPVSSPASIGRPHVCGDDYYPAISKRLGEQGTTRLGFTITADGRVENVHVEASSGSERLDNAAVTCATPWRYKPAVREGQPVAVQWHTEVKWVLH
ncbi:TonB family protein [Rhizomicrobium palustre]|uniref:energy transducer TonB n=1 Tax=Rhizomicrobium palustre TaxID=189966 RepID=UPI0031E02905